VKRGPYLTSIAIALVIVAGIAVYLGLGARPSLGLDLQGGISAIYSPVLDEGSDNGDFSEILDQTIEVIRARVDSLGVAEPDISRQGNDVLVQLPGLGQEDVERAQEIIGQTAKLTFRPVIAIIPAGTAQYDLVPECGSVVDEDDVTGEPLPDITDGGAEEPTDAGTETASPAPTPSVTSSQVGPVTVVGQASESPSPTPTPAPSGSPSPSPSESPTPSEPLFTGQPIDGPLPDDVTAVLCGSDVEELPGVLEADPPKYVVGSAVVTLDDDTEVVLDGSHIDNAVPRLGGTTVQSWDTSLDLDGPGGDAFAKVTSDLACQRDQGLSGQLAIVLDEVVQSAPQMNPSILCGQGISGGEASITSGATSIEESLQEARDLSLVLRTGALPVTLVPSTFETVSPTLGSESVRTGLLAGLLGLLLVAGYLVFFYRWLGAVAISSLTVFGAVMFGAITAMGEVGFALTLAGIAGVIVSIGITADSSILFFERIGDEVHLGKTVRTAVQRAFKSAFRTNLAGNTVTLAAALILYFLAIGPVRGFALMLGIATILDIIILAAWTRPIVSLMGNTRLLTRDTISRVNAPIRRGATKGGDA